jgi:CspA family cold shock protein
METYRSVDKELHDNKIPKKKGYGFIKKDDGSGDIFVHFTNIVSDGFKTLEARQKVEYEISQNHHGDQASNVRVLQEQVPSSVDE